MEDVSQTEIPLLKLSKTQILKNKQSSKRKSAEDVMIAVEYLSKVIEKLQQNYSGRPPSRKEIMDQMKLIGFDISRTTLWRYRAKINKVKSAVRDLLEEGSYSAYFDHNMELLDYIEEQAIACYNKQWTNAKSIKKQTYTKDHGIVDLQEIQQTPETHSGKAAFLNILAKVVDLRTNATNNENLDLSCSMLSEEFQNVKEKAESLEQKNNELEKELKSILKGGKSETSND